MTGSNVARRQTLRPFFDPFGASEMFVSSLLGWALQHVGQLRTEFLTLAADPRDPTRAPDHGAAIQALRDADDVVVTVESYAAVGNIDIALFSRAANALLLVENKTGAALSRDQVTKYRDAMRLADPGADGERRLATVVLCPKKDLDLLANGGLPRAGQKIDHGAFQNDWNGVARSALVDHEQMQARLYAPLLESMGDGRELGGVLLDASRRHLASSEGAAAADHRASFFQHLSQHKGLRTRWEAVPHAASCVLTDTATGERLRLTLGKASRSMLTLGFEDGRPRTLLASETGHHTPLSRYLRHLEVGKTKGSKTLPIPTAFPVFHWDKPWLRDDPAAWDRQISVLRTVLAGLGNSLAPVG